MNDEEKAKEIKEEMAKREQPDSVEIVGKTKESSVKLKCYMNMSEMDDTQDNPVQKKVDGLLKIKRYLETKGAM